MKAKRVKEQKRALSPRTGHVPKLLREPPPKPTRPVTISTFISKERDEGW